MRVEVAYCNLNFVVGMGTDFDMVAEDIEGSRKEERRSLAEVATGTVSQRRVVVTSPDMVLDPGQDHEHLDRVGMASQPWR